MQTPYDWQEAIGRRAEFIEQRLSHGSPAIAVSIDSGILFYTYRREARKVFEIYDHLAMAAIGQQSDVEAVRMAALDFAHQEGFNRSEQDVTIARVVTAVSNPIKRAFADFASAPIIARTLFAEVGAAPLQDRFVMVEYDGDYHARREYGFVASSAEMAESLDAKLKEAHLATASLEIAIEEVEQIWRDAVNATPSGALGPIDDKFHLEIALLERTNAKISRFKYIGDDEEI